MCTPLETCCSTPDSEESATDAAISKPRTIEVTIPPGTEGQWFVTSEGPAPSVAAAVALENVLFRRPWEPELASMSSGVSRSFTFSD